MYCKSNLFQNNFSDRKTTKTSDLPSSIGNIKSQLCLKASDAFFGYIFECF